MQACGFRNRFGALVVLAAFGSALLGCEPSSTAPRADAACREAGVQCALPDGPLGVCERAACPSGAVDPCFVCVSQH